MECLVLIQVKMFCNSTIIKYSTNYFLKNGGRSARKYFSHTIIQQRNIRGAFVYVLDATELTEAIL